MVSCSHYKKFSGFSRKILRMIGDRLIFWQGESYNLISFLLLVLINLVTSSEG